jgi:hypothetical protein
LKVVFEGYHVAEDLVAADVDGVGPLERFGASGFDHKAAFGLLVCFFHDGL